MTNEEQPVAATSRSLLKPANQKPTICYCKPGECSAPKPEWCIGRRYADGFREANAEPVAWEYKTADGWQRISLKNSKILKGSSFELRPIFDAKAGRRPTRSRT